MASALFDPDKNCFAGAAEQTWARFAAHPGHEAGNLQAPPRTSHLRWKSATFEIVRTVADYPLL